MRPLTEPRFPIVARRRGHYESFYLKAGSADARQAVWIRYTVHKRPGRAPTGSLWVTLFDAARGRPRAVKQTGPPGTLVTKPGSYLAIDGLGEFSPTRAAGAISAEGRRAAWELAIVGSEAALLHLPRALYNAPLPKTKLLSPTPAAELSGWVDVDGHRLELDAWRGMVGHNWGAQHAEQWVWLHGAEFGDHGHDTWIDVAMGRVALGPWTTPWIANGAISIDGERHRVGGLGHVRATHVLARPGHCDFELPGPRLRLRGTVRAPADDTVAWIYADPDGGEHHSLNCSIAAMELAAELEQGRDVALATGGGAVYELGTRETGHGIPVEPFGDG